MQICIRNIRKLRHLILVGVVRPVQTKQILKGPPRLSNKLSYPENSQTSEGDLTALNVSV